MNPWDTVAVAMLVLLGAVIGGGIAMALIVRKILRSENAFLDKRVQPTEESHALPSAAIHPVHVQRPARWLAIRSRNSHAVQTALRLHNPTPCSWVEGLLSPQKLFIAPPVEGWTLVFGTSLPNPDEDVDACYRFLRELSSKVGHVQFFQADDLMQHHAWAQVESGRVLRAYAWAGVTIWNQGMKTSAETALGMNCFAYGENPGVDDWAVADHIIANVDKVPQLAQRWSLDPAEIDLRFIAHQPGIAGTSTGAL